MDRQEPFSLSCGNQDDICLSSGFSNWTLDEHARFVDALEQLYCGNANTQDAWSSIIAAVRTRSIADVKQHASAYLFRLQALDDCPMEFHATVSSLAEPDITMKTYWTKEENTQLEDLLAAYSLPTASATYYPWALIAQHIPNKTQRDVQERYEQLCRDIERIDQRELWSSRRQSQPKSVQLRIDIQPSPTFIFSQCFPSPIPPLSPFPSDSGFERLGQLIERNRMPVRSKERALRSSSSTKREMYY